MSADGAAAEWWLALAGATVLVALWHTTAIALALALWRAWRPRTPARRAYVVACAALALAVAPALAHVGDQDEPGDAVDVAAERALAAERLAVADQHLEGLLREVLAGAAVGSGAVRLAAPGVRAPADLRAGAGVADFRVNRVGEIDRRRAAL